jgi:cellulose 1,4-beta-cellobiosidase
MMRHERVTRGLWECCRVRCVLVAGAASLGGCATGVDVTDDEFEEICASPNISCGEGTGGSPPATGGSVGGLGGTTSRGGTFGATGGTGTPAGGTFSATGGTGTGAGGASGSGGGAGVTQPLAMGDCLPMSDLVIAYRNRSAADLEDEPTMVMQLQNPAGTSFNLADLTIRYWFTADGTSNFIPTVDYASIDQSSISVTFSQEFGSDYAQMAFTSTNSVGAEGVQELQLRFHATPYTPMNQTNDFSFLQAATQGFTPNPNITPYLNGQQVGGCVPLP